MHLPWEDAKAKGKGATCMDAGTLVAAALRSLWLRLTGIPVGSEGQS